ncbi:MAG: Sec-dependent nitrous-oxide reductase [Balneolales bacterium]
MKSNKIRLVTGSILLMLTVMILYSCSTQTDVMGTQNAASKVYVAPGEYDEYYAFLSGGYNGQMSVWGLPSGRMFKNISVFSQYPETGYGYSEETKPLLQSSYGFIPWDDSHHPNFSRTNSTPDGRWIFINANNTPRVARIDLTSFETQEIIELPNTGGNHASSFVTENTEYIIGATRFSIPYDADLDVPIDSYKENFDGAFTFIGVDPESGRMSIDFQIKMPPYHYDIGKAGMGVSSDWVFFTTYNTEQAHSLLEVTASEFDKDYIVAVNWKKAEEYVNAGNGEIIDTEYYHNYRTEHNPMAVSDIINKVKLIDPADVPGMIYLLPTPKSPHGVDVDPTGEYLVAGGKLATTIPVHSFSKMLDAIENERFADYDSGIPILEYESTIAGEVENPGLGPLHTEFDNEGNAYTSVYISSEIVKWSLSDFTVSDRIDSYYSIGHLLITGGDTPNPDKKYMLGLTKTARDRFLPVGPKQLHPAQLYDISGDKMELILDFPTYGEPHYAQAIAANKLNLNAKQIYSLSDNEHPQATKRPRDVRIERDGNEVRVYMTSIRSHFTPDNIEGIKVGDTVYFHITNVEQDWDMVHGFAIKGMENSEILFAPGETKTIKWEPKRTGIYPFYCTAFCSALHQEMQGYVRVSAADSDVQLTWGTGE